MSGDRLKVVSTEDAPQERVRIGELEAHQCGPCSDDLGYPFSDLVEVRTNAVVKKGKLTGGSKWWGCPRCQRKYYRIGTVTP